MQASRAGADDLRARAPFDNRDVDTRQRELGRQHHPRRTSTANHHRMLRHRWPPVYSGFGQKAWSKAATLRPDPGLAARPQRGYMLRVAGRAAHFAGEKLFAVKGYLYYETRLAAY